jgi:hypothetical protein
LLLRISLTQCRTCLCPGSSRTTTTRSHCPLEHLRRAILATLVFLLLYNLATYVASPFGTRRYNPRASKPSIALGTTDANMAPPIFGHRRSEPWPTETLTAQHRWISI